MSITARRFAAAALFAVAAFATPAFADDVAVNAAPVRLFGTDERANAFIGTFPKWTGMLARYEREKALETAPCTGGNCALQNWATFVETLRGQGALAQLQAINAYVNRTPYQPDASRYGVADYWATPREFFGRSGDCEDYAIAKYLSLRKLGWSADRLRIVVLMHHTRRELHAVLVAYANGTAYVLDNLMSSVVEQGAVPYYQPYYSINEQAWYHHTNWSPNAARGQFSAVRPGGEGTVLVAARRPQAERTTFEQGTAERTAADRAAIYERAAMAPSRRMSPAARSYAGNAAESTASLFTGPNAIR
ncbi:MAG: transglutaminase-like cysteine peptidase [Rhodospirillaceae bacterium]|nr:transglutaminase-like cysteine peptidase [Rhodospirillaceae bacterium]